MKYQVPRLPTSPLVKKIRGAPGGTVIANKSEILALIDQIYAAALVPDTERAWQELLVGLERHLSGGRAIMALLDPIAHQIDFFHAPSYEPSAIRAYVEHYGAVNPWMEVGRRLPQGSWHSGEMLVDEKAIMKTEFYNDWLKPQDLHKGGGCTILKDGGGLMVLSFLKPRRMEAVTELEVDLMRKLLPHLQRAAQLRRHFGLADLRTRWAAEALDRLSVGVALLEPPRRIVFMNLRCKRNLAPQRRPLLEWLRRASCPTP